MADDEDDDLALGSTERDEGLSDSQVFTRPPERAQAFVERQQQPPQRDDGLSDSQVFARPPQQARPPPLSSRRDEGLDDSQVFARPSAGRPEAESRVGTALREFAHGIVPAVAGGFGAVGGGIIGGIPGAIAGGIGAGTAANWLEDKALKLLGF